MKVSISKGNAKMGAIPSVSLPACTTCNPEAPCFRKCYAAKIARLRATVRTAYERNFITWVEHPAEYWQQVRDAAKMAKYFRFHVSGDIPEPIYFYDMVLTAAAIPDTRFLVFTKQYHIVNDFIRDGGAIPDNLQVIFSNWGEWKCDNPYNLPTCEVILKGSEPADHWKICGGNCTECACRGVGCWELKHGETIAIYEH